MSGCGYATGQCTDYCSMTNSWIPCNMGDAANWWSAYPGPKGAMPIPGSVCVWGPGNESAAAPADASGHVADVQSVNSDGSFTVTEMNFNGGVGVVDTRTVTSHAGILGFLYPPGTSAAGVTGSNAGSVGTIQPSQLGQSYGASAAQGLLGMGANLIKWAEAHDVALLVAAVALYMLFAPQLKGGPEARV
jgi:hypothetical protein